jgi:hypothetical protein
VIFFGSNFDLSPLCVANVTCTGPVNASCVDGFFYFKIIVSCYALTASFIFWGDVGDKGDVGDIGDVFV